ncbi:putative glycosyltransferase group 2 family protein [Gregarina niphandrodes]|uniref:Glycosyltransferase group 2 family protein n=1 Tax=Gregarina niphandrodes TaxID=110365 RepID=A0A023B7L8_GRENI|nr:putative glycosyltransferase group 2 family protein [Gregarina niphandrodes]EZG67507.1 putative glycosyltransferase group 2 family protein [Gregarina niphandrodes]|eukprot:XP_011130222.1 putative glycosyltransferase group 2 family protein [Gregarina niphandrodes]
MLAKLWLGLTAVAFAKPVAPIAIVIPCNAEDFHFLPLVLNSIANQTVLPQETILVGNLPESHADGTLLLDTASKGLNVQNIWATADLQEKEEEVSLFSWIVDQVRGTQSMSLEETDQTLAASHEPPKFHFSADGNKKHRSPQDALRYITKVLPDTKEALSVIPRVKVYVRGGTHYAGSNRVYGAEKSSNDIEIVCFFDADDYMHPQRTEFIWRAFNDTSENIEALIHGFKMLKITEWNKEMPKFAKTLEYPDSWAYPSEKYWSVLPVNKLHEGQTEPSYGGRPGYAWWFSKDLGLHFPPGSPSGHNGWLSIKKSALAEVPYPDIRRGQDSLYNWRLIRAHKRWNFLHVPLGAYLTYR